MGDIKDKLEQLAADMPLRIKPNRAKKSQDLYDAMPFIIELQEKGYSLYQITQLLQAEGLFVSYSLIKNTVRKKIQETNLATELAGDFATEDEGNTETEKKLKKQALAEVQLLTSSPQSPIPKKYFMFAGKILEDFGSRLPTELIKELSATPASTKFNVTITNNKIDLSIFTSEIKSQLAEMTATGC